MPIRFVCRDCQVKIKVPSGNEDHRVKCPRCGFVQFVPGLAVEPTPRELSTHMDSSAAPAKMSNHRPDPEALSPEIVDTTETIEDLSAVRQSQVCRPDAPHRYASASPPDLTPELPPDQLSKTTPIAPLNCASDFYSEVGEDVPAQTTSNQAPSGPGARTNSHVDLPRPMPQPRPVSKSTPQAVPLSVPASTIRLPQPATEDERTQPSVNTQPNRRAPIYVGLLLLTWILRFTALVAVALETQRIIGAVEKLLDPYMIAREIVLAVVSVAVSWLAAELAHAVRDIARKSLHR